MTQADSRTSSIELYKRSLNERLSEFKSSVNRTVEVFAHSGHSEGLRTAVTDLAQTGQAISQLLSENDRPQWFVLILRESVKYCSQPTADQAQRLLTTLLQHWTSIRQIEFQDDEPALIDFDEVFRQYRDENRLPELFDGLICILNQIIQSDEIDSLTILETLRQAINLLRSNREGSYISVREAILSTEFMWNLVRESLDAIPGIKQLVTAYDKTKEQLSAKFSEADVALNNRVIQELAQRVPRVQKLPHFIDDSTTFVTPLCLPDLTKSSPSEVRAPATE